MAEPLEVGPDSGPIEVLLNQEEVEVRDVGRRTIFEHTFESEGKTYRGIVVDVFTVTQYNMLFEQIETPFEDEHLRQAI